MIVEPGEVAILRLQLDRDQINLFPRAAVINESDVVVATLAMSPLLDAETAGVYSVSYVFDDVGRFYVKYQVFEDSGFTKESTRFVTTGEYVHVTRMESNIEAIRTGPPVAEFN